MDVDTSSLTKAKFQWQLNGKNIVGANYSNYTIINATDNDKGKYSVYITSQSGIKNVNICEVKFFKKKKSHTALVIILVILFIILIVAGLYLYIKWRKRKSEQEMDKLGKLMDEKERMLN